MFSRTLRMESLAQNLLSAVNAEIGHACRVKDSNQWAAIAADIADARFAGDFEWQLLPSAGEQPPRVVLASYLAA